MRNQRCFVIPVWLKDELERGVQTMSAATAQALMNAHSDDSLLSKALKRRMALPPLRNAEDARMSTTEDPRITRYVEDLSERSRLTKEDVVRLAIEAYVYRL